jgi:hypothetical protein
MLEMVLMKMTVFCLEFFLSQVHGMSCFIGAMIVCAFADCMRRAIARVFTVVSVIDLFSSSLHERSLRRLAVAHDLVSPGEHSSCRDWFECLLRTKANLSTRECCSEGELNYFNGMSVTSALKFVL